LKFEFVKTHCFVKYIRYHYKITTTWIIVGGLYKLYVTRKGHQALASTTI
jgi:hypothetical protein